MKFQIPNSKLQFQVNIPLSKHTTFKIGGPARYFYEANTKDHLILALKAARKLKIPFFILGEGSNLLVSDKGFNGLVIKLKTTNYKLKTNQLYAQAGVSLSTLVRETGKRGLSGLEWAGGLPGTLGGAVFGNAGAFGREIKDSIVWVEALDKSFKIRKFFRKDCQFNYRSSVFKKRGWIVLSVLMKLRKGNRKTIQAVARNCLKQRKKRGPLEYPNAGSVFKNCDIKKVPEKTKNAFRQIIKVDPFPVIPTAAIIAKIPGLMGTRIGKAQISTKHPNFIVNLGGASAQDVLALIKLTKKEAKKTFGVDIEEEIRYIQ